MNHTIEPSVWITGANGQLGRDVVHVFLEHDIPFYQTDKEVSIVNKRSIKSFLKGKNIEYIINCAAYTNVENAESHISAAYDLNCIGPENLARECKDRDITLIHISTDYVFDGMKSTPYIETDHTSPLNSYGRTKLFGEISIQSILPKHYIIRTSRLYGKYGPKNFVYTMIRLFTHQNEVQVVADQFSSPTYSHDLAEVIYEIITNTSRVVPYGIFHYCNRGSASWLDFASEIYSELNKYLNFNCVIHPVPASQYTTTAVRPRYSVLNTQKIEDILDLYIPSWKESLSKFIYQYAQELKESKK